MKKFILLFSFLTVFVFFTNNSASFATNKKDVKKKTECPADEKAEGKESLKEIEDLHSFISPLFHKHYPDLNVKGMKDDLAGLKKVVKSMETMKLPKTLAPKADKFKASVKDLSSDIDELSQFLETNPKLTKDNKDLKEKVEKLHNSFHTLAELVNE